MNYNKVIKDLKERNDKLQEQYRLRDIRCIHLEYENEMLKSDFEAQHELTKKYAEESKELNQKYLNAVADYETTMSELQELKLELSGYRQAILNDKEMLGLKEENQELKRNCNIGYENLNFYREENQELKKQLEEKENIACNWKDSCLEKAGKIEILENQQKEFISYLEKTIEELECDDSDDEEIKGYLIQRGNTFKEILSKYKSIIGGKE